MVSPPQGSITIDGFYDNVRPLTALEREALGKLPGDMEATRRALGVQQLDVPLERSLAERLAA